MTDQPTFNRRRLLEVSGVGTTLAVAGCAGQVGDDLAGDERRVTMLLPEQGAIQELQMEIEQEVRAGELDEQQAQLAFQQRQAELLDDAYETVQTEFEAFDLTIEDTLQNQLLLVSGPATDLIDAVDIEEIGGLLGSDAFEQAREQQEPPAEPPEDDEPTQEELEEQIEEQLEEAEDDEE